MAFGEGVPKYDGGQKNEKQAVKPLAKPAEGGDIKRPKEELYKLKEQIKRLFDVSRQVLESVGYSHDQAKEMLDANSELMLELKDAVKATIEGCNGKLSVKTSTGETTALLDMPNRLMVSLTTTKGFPLFIEFRDGKNFPFYSKNVNDVISKLTGVVAKKRESAQSLQFRDFVIENYSKTLHRKDEKNAFMREYYLQHPYSERVSKLAKLFDANTPNRGYTEERLRGFIDEASRIADYSSKRIGDFDFYNDTTFVNESGDLLTFVQNALKALDRGDKLNLQNINDVKGSALIEKANRHIYYDSLKAMCDCLLEIVGKRSENENVKN